MTNKEQNKKAEDLQKHGDPLSLILVSGVRLTAKSSAWFASKAHEKLVKPVAKKANEQLDIEFSISRRNFLKWTAGAAGVGAFGGAYAWVRFGEWLESLDSVEASPKLTEAPKIQIKEFVKQRDYEFYAPFDGAIANEILANELHGNAGSFLFTPDSLLSKVRAHLDPQLLPIVSPSTMKRKQIIYKYSFDEKGKQNGWPVVISGIDAIESSGDIEAGAKDALGRPTPKHAQGSMQVMPEHFEEDGITDRAKMREPDINMKYGVDTFRGFLGKATEKNPQYKDTESILYVKALAGYNGGESQTWVAYDQLWNETGFYWDHMVRFLLTSEIASRLRKRGCSDKRIVQELNSEEIRARAYVVWAKGYRNHDEYHRICNAVSVFDFKHPGVTKDETDQLKGFYETYKRGYWLKNNSDGSKEYVKKVQQPLNPALSLYFYAGGEKIVSLPENSDSESWFNMDTKRN